MRLLLRAAIANRRHLVLVLITLVAMLGVTFASQMEVFAIKVMTSNGVDFFELFAPEDEEGAVVAVEEISHTQMETRWEEIDADQNGVITKDDAETYLRDKRKGNLIDRGVAWLDNQIGLMKNPYNLAGFLLIIAVFKAISLFANRYTTQLVSIRISRDLRQQYFEHIQSLPMSFYQQYNIGSLSSRVVADAATIAGAINYGLMNYLQTPIAIVSTLAICIATSWQLSFLIFIFGPLIVLPIITLARKIKKVAKQIQRNQENFTSVLIDFLAGIQTVKIFGMEKFTLAKYQEQNERMAKLEAKSARYDCATRPAVHGLATIVLASAMFFGLFVLKLHISQVIFFCALMHLFYEPVKKFAEQNAHIQRGVAAAERMYEVLNIKSDIEDAPDAVNLEDFKEAIEFHNVWFSYGGEWVLKDLSFSVKKGETVAIVGPTGAGKSTIVQLLPRLYDVQKGEILIDGKPIQAYTQRSVRNNVAFVPQKPFLFLDTIRANIAYGENLSDQEIQAASERAHAHEFISRLPEGYDSQLAEGGKNLSGGQQQRLAIARALAKKAPILIMDEATSSLDGVSENHIKQAIEALHGNVTQILIAHRFSTIENADRIIYLKHGEKLAEGPRDELLETCPEFRKMWEIMYNTETADTC